MTVELAIDSGSSGVRVTPDDIIEFHKRAGARAAVSRLFSLVGVRVPVRSESYYEVALDYYLGLLYADRDEPEHAVEHIRRSGVLPGPGGNQLFADHVRHSLEMHHQRVAGVARGLPTFLIASMPRSASASLTQTIAGMLRLPIFRISLSGYLIPQWLNTVSPGGAILHDHFWASPFNVEVMRQGGVREVFVLVRDPRAAAASFHTLLQRRNLASAIDPPTREQEICSLFLSQTTARLQSWIDLSVNPEAGIKIRWIDSRDVRADMRKVWTYFVDVLGPSYPAIRSFDIEQMPQIKANFVRGDDESWRAVVSPRGQSMMWDAMSPAMRDLLDLRP